MKMILQKFIAGSGYCSRRQAEELIRNKKVKVNNKIAELGQTVSEVDTVEIAGQKLELPKEKIYIKLNKPAGYVCTNRRFKGEQNVFDLLPPGMNYLIIAGRLDKESRGLLFLTNDGDLAARITHPRYEHEKEYVVTIQNYELRITNNELFSIFKRGIDIGDGDGIAKVKNIKGVSDSKFKIVLTEGKKRQIRRMFKMVSLDVEDLVRVRIGNLLLGNLPEGKWAYLTKEEIINLTKNI